jgi:hypothetical protein
MLKINGKTYKEAELTFNAVCELETIGINIMDLRKGGLGILRAYLPLCMGSIGAIDVAGEEIQKHIINGGDINELAKAFSKAVEESDFFQALSKTKEKNAPAEETKAK